MGARRRFRHRTVFPMASIPAPCLPRKTCFSQGPGCSSASCSAASAPGKADFSLGSSSSASAFISGSSDSSASSSAPSSSASAPVSSRPVWTIGSRYARSWPSSRSLSGFDSTSGLESASSTPAKRRSASARRSSSRGSREGAFMMAGREDAPQAYSAAALLPYFFLKRSTRPAVSSRERSS